MTVAASMCMQKMRILISRIGPSTLINRSLRRTSMMSLPPKSKPIRWAVGSYNRYMVGKHLQRCLIYKYHNYDHLGDQKLSGSDKEKDEDSERTHGTTCNGNGKTGYHFTGYHYEHFAGHGEARNYGCQEKESVFEGGRFIWIYYSS